MKVNSRENEENKLIRVFHLKSIYMKVTVRGKQLQILIQKIQATAGFSI